MTIFPYLREHPLMTSYFRRDGGSEMTPKNWTLEDENRTLGGDGGSKIGEVVM